MQAKQYLKELRRIALLIRQKQKEKDTLYNTLKGTTADSVRVKASKDGDSMTKLLIRIGRISDRIDKQIAEYINLRHTIINQIHGLDNEMFIEILYRRYVEDKRLEDIAKDVNYSPVYTRRLHGHALQAFEQKYREEIDAYAGGW